MWVSCQTNRGQYMFEIKVAIIFLSLTQTLLESRQKPLTVVEKIR